MLCVFDCMSYWDLIMASVRAEF